MPCSSWTSDTTSNDDVSFLVLQSEWVMTAPATWTEETLRCDFQERAMKRYIFCSLWHPPLEPCCHVSEIPKYMGRPHIDATVDSLSRALAKRRTHCYRWIHEPADVTGLRLWVFQLRYQMSQNQGKPFPLNPTQTPPHHFLPPSRGEIKSCSQTQIKEVSKHISPA